MAQPHHTWGLFDAPAMRPTLPRDETAEDEDLFNAALLFLDHHDDSLSDASDSYSVHTAEDATPYQQEQDSYHHNTLGSTWAPTQQSFQEQLADVDLHLPLDTPATAAPSLFLDATASLALDALTAPAWRPSQAPSPTPPRRINKRRLEIERLRVESQALTKRLANLKDHTGEAPSSDAAPEHAGVAELLGSAWQNIAARQLEQRHRSEAENRRLKNLLNEHKRMAKALRRLVARHANTKAWDPLQTSAPPRPVRGTAESAHLDAMDDPAIFDQLAETLDSMYAETDAILSDPTLAAKDASQSDVKTEQDGDKGLRVQVLGSRTMPFGFTATSETVWDYMFRHCGPKVLQWEPTDRVDTFRTDFVAYTEMCHIKGFGRAKMMLRRVDEPHRVVLMRSALYQCPGSDANDGAKAVRRPMRHCMWKIIRKPTGESPKDDVCQIVSCELLMPAFEVEGLDEAAREAEAATLATMCTQISRFHATQADIFIDNSLLRPAAQSPREVEAVPQCLGATEVVW